MVARPSEAPPRCIARKSLTLAQVAAVAVVAELDAQLDHAPDTDGDQADTTNAGHDLLQVGNVVCALQWAAAQP
jgi:hypothetical protein